MEDDMSAFCIKSSGFRHGGTGGGAAAGGNNKCGRWNPTSEQVKVLTDLFRSGLRTPSTDQIQRISTQLSFYGKIESKNVFYWFQNHKARERQKRRKVSVDDTVSLRRDHTLSSSLKKQFTERHQVMEPEKVIETLQLFPVDSFEGSESEKIRVMHGKECKETIGATAIGYSCGSEMDHPPLDLRLSFI